MVSIINKSNLAAFLIRALKVSNLIKRLYPIAIRAEFRNVTSTVLLDLGNFLRIRSPQSLNMVRLGSDNDGGYVLFNDFKRDDVVLSFGVGDNNTFDLSIGPFVNVVHMYDHTVPGPPIQFENGQFHQLGISDIDKVQFRTVPAILEEIPRGIEIILKIDIEGAEWDIFNSLNREQLSRFKQIVGEFHFFHDLIKSSEGQEKILSVLSLLTESHTFVNLHANNWGRVDLVQGFLLPDVLEFALVRNDRLLNSDCHVEVISTLNKPNNPLLPDIYLNFLSES